VPVELKLKPKISPELVKQYQKIFDSYDKEQDGYVQAKDVPAVLKILGVGCTEQEGSSILTQLSKCWETEQSNPITPWFPLKSISQTSWPSW
jgi:Ca2+-binding EF-hand superfamily protein